MIVVSFGMALWPNPYNAIANEEEEEEEEEQQQQQQHDNNLTILNTSNSYEVFESSMQYWDE